MVENLRIYSHQLTAKLKEKEETFADLQNRFTKLQGRFAQLDYAFKQNLELHQEQMMEIYDLRISQKELRKAGEERSKEYCKLEEQLTRVTNEKEVAKNGLAYWKQATIDQKKFYEGKYEECVRACKLRTEADAAVYDKTITETKKLAEKHIQELANRWKAEEEKAAGIRKKAVVLQGDVDVLRHRMQELAGLIETFPGLHKKFEVISSCIVQVLRSFSITEDDYEFRMKELRNELLRQISQENRPLKPTEDISDYETIKSQNLVLREVVKKLKHELNQVKKEEAIMPRALSRNVRSISGQERELIPCNSLEENLQKKLPTEETEAIKLVSEAWTKMKGLETNLEIMRAGNDERVTISKSVQTDNELFYFSEDQVRRGLSNEETTEEAYWELKERPVKKFKKQATRDTTKSLELNFEPLEAGGTLGKNYVTLKDKQKVQKHTGTNFMDEENEESPFIRGPLESIESHLNSIRFKEYTVSFSMKHRIKIRHPTAPVYSGKRFQLKSVYSEEEYQSIPVDESVLYFNFTNDHVVSKMTNCSIQTLRIETVNISTQTPMSKETLTAVTSTGVKILNSERRAIERSLRDLEKTVSEACEETLEDARSLIIRSSKFPPSEEFFDCIRHLSQCGTT